MKKFRNILLIVMTVMMTASCVEEMQNPDTEKTEITFTASFGQDTRTVLAEGTEVHWLPGDFIYVHGSAEPNVSCMFMAQTQTISATTTFKGNVARSDTYYAVYPAYNYDGDFIVPVSVPMEQSAVKGSFADDLNIAVSMTTDQERNFIFHNVLGYVKLTIGDESGDITSVRIQSNNDEQLSGWFDIDYSSESPELSAPSAVNPADHFSKVILRSDTVLDNGDYYIAMIPGEYKLGLTFTFEDVNGMVATKVIEDKLTLNSGVIKDVGTVKGLAFENPQDQKALEREALVALYDAADGDNWTNNENWCSDRPVDEWFGISVNEDGYVSEISLLWNNMQGTLPEEIDDLKYIEYISFQGNPQLGGLLPEDFWELTNLKGLSLAECSFSGEIPEDIANLKKLKSLSLCFNNFNGHILDYIKNLGLNSLDIRGNAFSGTIPGELAKLWDNESITVLDFNIGWFNLFTGEVPKEMIEHPKWKYMWGGVVQNEGLTNVSPDIIPAPEFEFEDMQGCNIMSSEIFAENKLTLLYQWDDVNDINQVLLELYEKYKEYGLEIISMPSGAGAELPFLQSKMEAENHTWITCRMGVSFFSELQGKLVSNTIGGCSVYPNNTFIAITAIDSDGKLIYSSCIPPLMNNEGIYAEVEKLVVRTCDESIDYYTSTDYSADGKVTTLHTATKGNGVDVVLMGDAYSDRLIADGTYAADMKAMMDAFFSEEPYKSHMDYFNVYAVNVVSENEVYDTYSSTALGGWFGYGTEVGGNDARCFNYGLKAISAEQMDEALIIVAMNLEAYAGTCYMYYPESATGTYGSGPSVAYFPKGEDEDMFAQLLHHEANGHGFAKLADEYAYEALGTVPDDYAAETQEQQVDWGWWKNVDFTDDVEDVRWSYFLADERYDNEGLGCFEGGLTYWSGVWRPTENSIMRYNTGGFNAPSREAIYYRIHKLAYGDSWEYDYEDFVEYDAVNRTAAASAARRQRVNYVERAFEPTAAPVVTGRSWRQAR